MLADTARRMAGTRRRNPGGTTVALRPADPFELIRWLARSQTDPRKAAAELVQNSLDAGAGRIEVARVRLRGRLALVVRDDGEGVLPDLERHEALKYLATHVGHSRKLGLSPAERAQRVVAGCGDFGAGCRSTICRRSWGAASRRGLPRRAPGLVRPWARTRRRPSPTAASTARSSSCSRPDRSPR